MAKGGPQDGDPQDESAKHALDSIGAEVQKIAHDAALRRSHNELQGRLSDAIYKGVKTKATNACQLSHEYETGVTWGESYPCAKRSEKRFSDDGRSQCSTNRISGNNSNTGACAPYRKLQLCDYNLEKITDTNTTTTHNLLADVLLAAKYEGESLKGYHDLYLSKYPDSNSQLCTVLARSFADIGDIIRGKDLYLGNKKQYETEREKEILQKNLKNIFAKIYDQLKPEAKEYYEEDKKEGNFYQLREDWWDANRLEVWKAITCDVKGNIYFRATCGDARKPSLTQNNCHCAGGTVPTYFDYVPQYLRWFEEWAEDFCTKRKHKLQNAIKNCRGDKNEKYCSRNGYDCTKTIRSIDEYSVNRECTKCLFACDPYVKWIAKQKEEFEKQKEKCEIEIYKNKKSIQSSPKVYNNMYETDFYGKLKKEYKNMSDFLKLLNNETQCKNIIDEKNRIDFTKNPEETFSHTEYCDPCPWCGLKKENEKWIRRADSDPDCPKNPPYTPPDGVQPTEIDVLQKDEKGKDILQKLNTFCSSPDGKNGFRNEEWKCYYEKNNDKCVLENGEESGGEKKIKTFDVFFMFWVTHMLKDSIEWRSKLSKCLKTDKKQCVNKCNSNCKCYERWVSQKEKEWTQIKEHFEKQTDLPENYHFRILEGVLEDEFFKVIEEAYGNPKAIEKIKAFLKEESTKEDHEIQEKKDAIDFLLEHEEDEAELCLQTHEDDEKCSDSDDDSDDDDHEEEVYVNNPCAKPSGSAHRALATKVAHQMHDQAKTQLTSRGGGRKTLRADASKGTYKKKGKPSDLKENICNINTTHSNDSRTDGEPCTGKDKPGVRFEIGTDWQGDNFVNETHKYLYIPPRRQHMCTSNLENLDVGSVINNPNGGSPGDSLLGDVMLAANKQAERIKNDFSDKKYDNAAACRAIRYSFADIGDIIRGRDMWDKDKGSSDMETRLITVFEKINEKLPDGIQKKYKKIEDQKHLHLREDWWEANRHQVWNAMKCPTTKKFPFPCDKQPTPYDDYIPQRLRWMTEWAEWYCKMQKEEYEKLKVCEKCMNKGKCEKGNGQCDKCKEACDNYKKVVGEWEEQWNNMLLQYLILYYEANTTAPFGGISAYGNAVGEKDKPVVAFLQELQKTIRSSSSKRPKRSTDRTNTDPIFTSPYSSAAGYIHQELPNVGCNTQKEFCDKKNGDTSSTATNNDKYAFMQPPKGYEEACNCENNTKPQPAPKKEEEACNMVNTILSAHAGKNEIDSCNEKNDRTWNCSDDTFNEHNKGACMPPRRQSLCIHDLKELTKNSSKEQLREAFIKCAAIETHFLWIYYKNKNSSIVDTQLQNGNIPDEFKRIMYYTFGDYRDICLGTDISSDSNIKCISQKVNDILNSQYGKTHEQNITPKTWWEKNKNDIWQGILCALPHSDELKKKEEYKTPPEEFAKTPQFLRWFIEWSDEFCREREKKEAKVKVSCSDANDHEGCENSTGNASCVSACKDYEGYITKKKTQYDSQERKFKDDKTQRKPGYNDILNKDAPEYLKDKCFLHTCSCMEKVKTIGDYWKNPHETYENSTIKNKCECPKPPTKACKIVEDLFKPENETKFTEACSTKYKNGKEKYTQWKCINDTTSSPSDKETPTTSPTSTSTCIPPRRQKLYLKKIEELTSGGTPHELRKAFIECAAVETFFAWHKFKMDKKKEDEERKEAEDALLQRETSADTEQKQLETGDIPEEFKRQMFYTLGDYRDILFGKDVCSGNGMEKLKNNIERFFINVTQKPDNGKNGDKERENWWKEYGPHIWDGMLCALSYKSYTPTMDPKLRDKLKEHDKKNNYQDVTFEGGFNSDESTKTTTTTKLDNFVKRPTYFRWLEEWGEEFCRKQKHKLYIIEKECKVEANSGSRRGGGTKNPKCSCYGEECKIEDISNIGVFADLKCPRCGRHCRKYKKWIEKKKTEYEKQKEAYGEQKKDATTKSGIYNQEFLEKLEKCQSIDSFLNSLKDGPCKVESGEDKKEDDYIKFKEEETFQPAKDCKPCSKFSVNCENVDGNCTKDRGTSCQTKNSIGPDDIENEGNSTNEVVMRVSDNDAKGFNGLDEACKDAHIFKGIRKDEWKCRNVCGVDICGLKKVHEKNYDQIILIRALIERWLETFLEDYNEIRKKLKPCMNKGEQSTCINDYDKKHKCVKQWIEKKKTEWGKIKKHYLDKNEKGDDGMTSLVRNFLEDLQPQTEVLKAIKPCKTVSDFDSKRCNANASTEKENGKKIDIVECLIEKLRKEAKKCEETQAKCENASIPLPNEEEEIPEENPVTQPNICPAQQPEDQTEETCEEPKQEKEKEESEERKDTSTSGGEGSATPELPVPTTENSETNNQTPKDTKPLTPPAPKHPRGGEEKKAKPSLPNPPTVFNNPQVQTALVTSTLAWSVGIGFAAFTYFYLKKKEI
ncbi:hypothetical protein C923_00704 [Plasmodium falciparum UGT5.1]|uniref:Erythrocyte membrane protein 1, PfEMP1 n=1 Tax=Plasmodium falciparum UGT5.1 TaxID=1237627 RepID=W7JU30_PLAFA|nr:hypothetical protein C923_00704 [Plasmodium falciparum UGT5.1]